MVSGTCRIVSRIVGGANRTIVEAIVIVCRNRTAVATAVQTAVETAVATAVQTAVQTPVATAIVLRIRL